MHFKILYILRFILEIEWTVDNTSRCTQDLQHGLLTVFHTFKNQHSKKMGEPQLFTPLLHYCTVNFSQNQCGKILLYHTETQELTRVIWIFILSSSFNINGLSFELSLWLESTLMLKLCVSHGYTYIATVVR